MKIAVLGAGILGCGVAIELAEHGHSVDLFDQEAEPVRRASWVNEGKIHQGFVYANDPSGKTARLMAKGALTFRSILSRWIDTEQAVKLSTPFIYLVHKDTMVDADRLRIHFAACTKTNSDLIKSMSGDYLGRREAPAWRELSLPELEGTLDPNQVLTAFQTTELAVDTRPIGAALAARVSEHPRVSFRSASRVVRVAERQRSHFVSVAGRGVAEGPYDAVVNALWEGRLAVDETVGIRTMRTPMYRHKFGSRVLVPLSPADIPSLTMILGPYGDIVNYGQGGMYLSWYPFGMVDSTSELEPPIGWIDRTREARMSVFRKSYEKWLTFCPALGRIRIFDDDVDPVSGIIFAWGATDITDPESELHERHSIGISSRGNYHSVNTGKYTVAPLLALEAAQRVMSAHA